jgi:tetratricopeptide (TPR) repeat protein
MYSWTGSGFEEGIHYLEQALRLEPEHAVAHVALAWLCIMSSQADQSGNIRQRGVDHCMRALAIDPMLSDARAALGWAKMLDELFEEGEALGREAVALDPGSHLNLIALGYIQISVGMKTGSRTKCIEAARACIAALVADPRDQAALMPLGCVYSLAADYDTAENLFRRALDAERLQGAEMRMIGSLSFLGHTQMRQQKLDEARKTLEYAANEYADAPQIFAPYINALTLCGLGDLERLAGRYDEAIAHYLRGRVLLDRMPGLVGSGYLVARLETRLASAYGRIHLRSEEARHAEAAREVTLSRRHYSFAWCWFVSEAELHYDWALYHATCAAKGKMLDDLRQAVSQGWAEVSLLDLDPAFAFYRSDPEVKAVFEQARRLQPLPELASS